MDGMQHILALSWPMRLEYFSGLYAIALWGALAVPVVLLGMRSLTGLGPVRKWVAIGIRLLVLAVAVMLLGGMRWQRQHKDVEVIVVRDVSDSTQLVTDYPGKTLNDSVNAWLNQVAGGKSAQGTTTGKVEKKPDDRIGVISFQTHPRIDAIPDKELKLDSRSIPEPESGTDASAALQLGMATFSKDAMRRMVLIWDGNATSGNLEAAISSAVAQHVPIDVMPLKYNVQHEVMVDKIVSPTWKRENEPFTVDVMLRSTNVTPIRGKMRVTHQGVPMDLDPVMPGMQATRAVTLQPGLNVEHVRVPALSSVGVHQFHAIFEAENVLNAKESSDPTKSGDSLAGNNAADAFTFVRGKGQVLFVDNSPEGRASILRDSLVREGINVAASSFIKVDQFPTSPVQLLNYDAVILYNVPRGAGGLSDDQAQMVSTYVHDMGGGLVVVGGNDSFGAGGWQGSTLEKVLPVNMDIPAERQIAKGALVLVMHSCEMPNGNYWGEQCAIKAVETLSAGDEIGVISYDWSGRGATWDFPLAPKGDGSKVIAAIKKMKLGDMPSFDDSMSCALNGKAGEYCLAKSDAKQKHVIVVSDGDPAAPNPTLVANYNKLQITASTISVYPHNGPQTMIDIAKSLHGKHYGPIESNPSQLPQIFIKEATIVRRSLIQKDMKGIPLAAADSTSELVRGIDSYPPVFGLVLTTKKKDPQVQMPIIAGSKKDPLFAHWQTGLGHAAVYTSDAHNDWGTAWVGSAMYQKFWSQVVRGVSRPPMSGDFTIDTSQADAKAKVTVEAMNRDSTFLSFLNIRGTVVGPDMKPHDVKLVQTAPGTYQAEFDTPNPGNYVTMLNYTGPNGQQGVLLSGVASNASPELRELQSNEGLLQQIAEKTNGRVLAPFDPTVNLFDRAGLVQSSSPLPIWEILLPILMGLIILDVAARRIAWDWIALKRYAFSFTEGVRAWTLSKPVATGQSVDALRKIREGATQKPAGDQPSQPAKNVEARPDRSVKFEAKGVEGDISKVVGGATDKPIPSAPKDPKPKGAPDAGATMNSLMEAKRRAQQKMKDKE